MRLTLVGPRELSKWNRNERVPLIQKSRKSIVPCKRRRRQSEPSTSFKEILILSKIITNRKHQKGHRESKEQAKECDGRANSTDHQETGEYEPTYY